MDITKEFIEKIVELAGPNYSEFGDVQYSDKRLYPVDMERTAEPIETHTLKSITQYVNELPDYLESNLIVHVKSPREVEVISEMNTDKKRSRYVHAEAFRIDGFITGRYMSIDQFVVGVMQSFVQDENTANLIAFVSGIHSEEGLTQTDDGVSQVVTVKSGIQLVKKAKSPNPIALRPYNTFPEVTQPQIDYVFRLKKSGENVEAALFASDSGAWKIEALKSIEDYLRKEIRRDNVIIIA